VIPLGRDLDRFLALDPRAEPGDGEVVALYAGRLVPVKRVDVLLRALARARASGARLRLVVSATARCGRSSRRSRGSSESQPR
jgi:glycosyltransferase involved in cell wall biosynthesis